MATADCHRSPVPFRLILFIEKQLIGRKEEGTREAYNPPHSWRITNTCRSLYKCFGTNGNWRLQGQRFPFFPLISTRKKLFQGLGCFHLSPSRATLGYRRGIFGSYFLVVFHFLSCRLSTTFNGRVQQNADHPHAC